MYLSNPGMIAAISQFPWEDAGKDATRMYKSIRSYDARGTLDNATNTVNMLKSTVLNTHKPVEELKDFIHSAWQDKDIFEKVNDLLNHLYKPLQKFEDGQSDIIDLVHNINIQLKYMQHNEIHQLAAKLIHVIGAMQMSMTPENLQIFKNAAIVFTDKINQTNIEVFNKLLKETDFSIGKINSIFKP